MSSPETLKTETRLKGMETNGLGGTRPHRVPATLKTETRLKGMETEGCWMSATVTTVFENRDPLKGDGNSTASATAVAGTSSLLKPRPA